MSMICDNQSGRSLIRTYGRHAPSAKWRKPSNLLVSHASRDGAIAPHATDSSATLGRSRGARVHSQGAAETAATVADRQGSLRQGSRKKHESPPGCLPGDSRAVRYDIGPACLNVVAPPLHVYQEPGERGPVNDVGTVLRALAVADCGDSRQVSGDLNAAPVESAQPGLAPDGVRQVNHFVVTPFSWRVFRGTPWCPRVRAPRRTRARTPGCNCAPPRARSPHRRGSRSPRTRWSARRRGSRGC
jgi:hypothetical protein